MLENAVFWATILICAAFYFGATISGLEIAGQSEAVVANRIARLSIVVPSFVMFLRDALRMIRR